MSDDQPAMLTTEEATKRETISADTPDMKGYYANNVGFRVSPWDFTMIFGQIREATKERLVIENQAEIVMSPQHIKVFARVLRSNIEKYEARFGAIPELGGGAP